MRGVSAEIMAEIDRRAQTEYSISQAMLMENAGRAVVEEIVHTVDDVSKEKVAVVCGKGNNGGDGFVIARLLKDEFFLNVLVVVPEKESIKPGAAAENFIKIKESGVQITTFMKFLDRTDVGEVSIVVDSIFGTGFKGDIGGIYADIVKWMNTSGGRIVAVDIPSGLNATTGVSCENSVKAERTVTFGLPKQGFFSSCGLEACGAVVVKNIGFPEELLEQYTDTLTE